MCVVVKGCCGLLAYWVAYLDSAVNIFTGTRYFATNAIQALDVPAEYFVDPATLTVSFIPPATTRGPINVTMSVATENIISLNNVSFVTLQNIHVAYSRAGGIYVTNSTAIKLVNISVSNVGLAGITLRDGANNTVSGATVSNTGAYGIHVAGGDRQTLVPCGHVVSDSIVHTFSQRCLTYTPGVQASGVGITVARNEIFDGPHSGIITTGNDNVFIGNVIHHTIQQVLRSG
jgi:parallel beta-helix repeat protein